MTAKLIKRHLQAFISFSISFCNLPMGRFEVVALSQSGVAVLESDDAKPVKNKLDLYKGSKRAAVVVDTIASVRDPLYLAAPLIELKKKDTLTPKGD